MCHLENQMMNFMQNPIIFIGKLVYMIFIKYKLLIRHLINIFNFRTFLVGIGAPPNSNSEGFLELSIIASLLLMLTITMILIFCIFMRWVSSKRNSIIYGQ